MIRHFTFSLVFLAVTAAVLAGRATLVAGGSMTARPVTGGPATGATRIISIVGTNDLHGFVLPAGGRGGIAWLGGYVKNLRAARARDPIPGGVVLLDGGDTFQGGIESNLSEGLLVIDAYNALGYTGLAIGNHEFDFGPLHATDPADNPDARGAIKAMARRAQFPLLSANLLDAATGQRVDWPNVPASTLVTIAGVRIGVIGAITMEGLRATLAANVHGLQLAPIAQAVGAEAVKLRAQGAQLVLLTTHAGGYCSQVTDPADLWGCDTSAEIVRLIEDLPHGTLDAIVAGHTHSTLAHLVHGVPVIESLWGGRAFGRVDLVLDAATNAVTDIRLFPTHNLCTSAECEQPLAALGVPVSTDPVAEGALAVTSDTRATSATATGSARVMYEGQPVREDEDILRAMAPELVRVRQMQAEPLPVTVDTLMRRGTGPGASLGNLFADAMREATPGADVSLNNNGFAGLRADLPAGPLTFGRLYDVFPFDNRVVQLTLTGRQLERVFAEEIKRARPGALSVSGVRVQALCEGDDVHVRLLRFNGEPLPPDTPVSIVTTDMLAAGAVFAPVAPTGGVVIPPTAPIARVVVERWLRKRGGHVSEDQFLDTHGEPRWAYPPTMCAVH